MSFPLPLDARGFLTDFPDSAPTDVYSTAQPFKVSLFVLLVKRLISCWRPLVQQKGHADFATKTRELVDKLINYFGDYAECADECEVACFLEEFMRVQFDCTLHNKEQWQPALWLIEAFYRMQAGDYCVNNAVENAVILPFLVDKIVYEERARTLIPKENREGSSGERFSDDEDDDGSGDIEDSYKDEEFEESDDVSYDDGIYVD